MPVTIYKKAGPSGRVLKVELEARGYNGPEIHWGRMTMNKREALIRLNEEGVPTPKLYLNHIPDDAFPIVGRRDFHAHQSGMFICTTPAEYARTRRLKRPPTHYLEWIDPPLREFRVHVAFNKVLKLMDRATGWYPGSGPAPAFDHKVTLRQVALDAVEALGMDFGAVDILWTEKRSNGTEDKGFMVLEVNSGPDLKRSEDTRERYIRAFMELYDEYPEDPWLQDKRQLLHRIRW